MRDRFTCAVNHFECVIFVVGSGEEVGGTKNDIVFKNIFFVLIEKLFSIYFDPINNKHCWKFDRFINRWQIFMLLVWSCVVQLGHLHGIRYGNDGEPLSNNGNGQFLLSYGAQLCPTSCLKFILKKKKEKIRIRSYSDKRQSSYFRQNLIQNNVCQILDECIRQPFPFLLEHLRTCQNTFAKWSENRLID